MLATISSEDVERLAESVLQADFMVTILSAMVGFCGAHTRRS